MNKNPIQPIIVSKFPSYLSTEYPNFFRLLSDFYTWLDDNFIGHVGAHLINSEVNSELEPYVSKIMNEIGWDYELSTPGDKKLVTNTLIDFYLSKGNEYSFEYLFRALFNDTLSIDYPRKKLFTLSSADYRNENFVMLSSESIGSDSFLYILGKDNPIGITIRGYISESVENVNHVTQVIYNNKQFLLVSIDDVSSFRPFETVHLDLDGVRIFEKVYNTVTLHSISNGGTGYKRGDIIEISGSEINGLARVKNLTSGSIIGVNIKSVGSGYKVGDSITTEKSLKTSGFGFFAYVSRVSVSGGIIEINITNEGYDYEEIPKLVVKSDKGDGAILSAIPYRIGGIKEIEFPEPYWIVGNENDSNRTLSYEIKSDKGEGAILSFVSNTCIYESKKEFFSTQGVLGFNGIIPDNLYFQEYSYELNSSVPPKFYQKLVDDAVHPVGLYKYVVYNHDSPLEYNFNRLDFVKFDLRDSSEKFLSLTFETEKYYKNISAVETEDNTHEILARGYYGENLSQDLKTGLTFIRYSTESVSEIYLSSQERINPPPLEFDTLCEIDDLVTGISFIRQYDSGQSMEFFGIKKTYWQINADGINEVLIG